MLRSLPEIRVRIQHPDEPDAYPWWDFDTEDVAAIRECRRFPYAVEIFNQAGQLVGDLSNLVAGPGIEGTYASPWDIPDAAVAYYAADCWTYACDIAPGTLFRLVGGIYRVIGAEHISLGYGDIGYATGFLICQATSGNAPIRINMRHATDQVPELTTPKCSTHGCSGWAAHVLETDNPYFTAGYVHMGPARNRKPVCEPCGTSSLNTNRISVLNPTLTEGTI